MRRTKNWVIAMALLSGVMESTTVLGAETKAQWCEQQWNIESAKAAERDPPNYAWLLARWQEYGTKCTGTVIYEARLAVVYSLLSQTNKAREVLIPYIGKRANYSYLVDLSVLQAEAADMLNGTIKVEEVQRLEEKYLAYVNKYPEFPDGYGILGSIQTSLGKHNEAIKSLEIGKRSSMDLTDVYRNLTICYTAVGRFEEAIGAADEAIRLDRRLTGDRYFAYALAKAGAGVGNFKSAETVLKVIAAKNPEVRRDPEFKEAVDFVLAKDELAKRSP